jgi:hypothetical protein
MRITIEFDLTAGTAKVVVPTSTGGPAAAQLIIQGTAQDAGAYTGVTIEQEPSAVRPQSTTTGSTSTPIIIDDFGALPGADGLR